MKLRRLFAAIIDILILSTLYFTLLGLLFNIGIYAPFIASCIQFPIMYYVCGKNKSPGKIIFMLEDTNSELNAYQRLKMYPVTLVFLLQMAINAVYPFFVLTLSYVGLILVLSMYLSLVLLILSMSLCLILNNDFWNIKFNNKVIMFKKEMN